MQNFKLFEPFNKIELSKRMYDTNWNGILGKYKYKGNDFALSGITFLNT